MPTSLFDSNYWMEFNTERDPGAILSRKFKGSHSVLGAERVYEHMMRFFLVNCPQC